MTYSVVKKKSAGEDKHIRAHPLAIQETNQRQHVCKHYIKLS